MKRGKEVRCEGIKLPNTEVMKEVEREGYTYLGIVELDKIKENEMREKTIKEYKRSLRLVLKSKLNGKNKITAWAVHAFRYGARILQWKEIELKDAGNQGNNGKVWSVTLEERCGQIIHKEETGRKRSDECGTLRQRRVK